MNLSKFLNRPMRPENIEDKGTKLKHYKSYLRKLTRFASSLGIKVEFSENFEDEGMWQPTRKIIKINPQDQSQAHIVASLLHELGHVIDDLTLEDKIFQKLNRAYKRVYSTNFNGKAPKVVIDTEKRAWLYGQALARMLKIELGDWYVAISTKYLNSYRFF